VKAQARVYVWCGIGSRWALQLHSDIGWANLLQSGESTSEHWGFNSKAAAIARARAWARRLGDIPVEVEREI